MRFIENFSRMVADPEYPLKKAIQENVRIVRSQIERVQVPLHKFSSEKVQALKALSKRNIFLLSSDELKESAQLMTLAIKVAFSRRHQFRQQLLPQLSQRF